MQTQLKFIKKIRNCRSRNNTWKKYIENKSLAEKSSKAPHIEDASKGQQTQQKKNIFRRRRNNLSNRCTKKNFKSFHYLISYIDQHNVKHSKYQIYKMTLDLLKSYTDLKLVLQNTFKNNA